MNRQPSERELLAELVACAESDECEQELAELLLVHGARISQMLGVTPSELDKIGSALPDARRARVRQLMALARERSNTARTEQLSNLARAAADMAAGLARFREKSVELDARIVLGNLLADSSARFLRFDVEGYEPVIVARGKLKEVSRALKGRELRCLVDEQGLHFVWATGTLTLYRQRVGRHDQDRVLHVVVARPLPVVAVASRAAPVERLFRPAAILGDVLADIGFFG